MILAWKFILNKCERGIESHWVAYYHKFDFINNIIPESFDHNELSNNHNNPNITSLQNNKIKL
jgi:hypothetical protein